MAIRSIQNTNDLMRHRCHFRSIYRWLNNHRYSLSNCHWWSILSHHVIPCLTRNVKVISVYKFGMKRLYQLPLYFDQCSCIIIMTSVLNTSLCCSDAKPVIDLFNDDDADDDGDIFTQMSSRPSAENTATTAAKHKV